MTDKEKGETSMMYHIPHPPILKTAKAGYELDHECKKESSKTQQCVNVI